MVKFNESMARLFENVFVCRKCKSKIRANYSKVLQKKIACRKCGYKNLRPIKKSKLR